MYIEIGYGKDAKITDKEIKKQLDLTLRNLKKEKIIDDSVKLVDYVAIIMDPAYVHIETEINKKINKLKENLTINNIYTIGRYGSWIYNSMEESMVKAKELAQKLKDE